MSILTKYRYLVALVAISFLTMSFQDTIDENGQEKFDRSKPLVYVFDLKEPIMPAAWRMTKRSFEEAEKLNAAYILIHMNTYGGMVDVADSIRTIILNSEIPVYVFIDNNAASAGALISIAADSIYMRPGGNIGAATVVNQTGEAMPDKYQSYMRSTMRATAESHGKDTVIRGNDTIADWHRDPLIAEAMVDPRTSIPGIIDTGKVLTFTAEEAIKHGYAEGLAESIPEVLELAGVKEYEIRKQEVTGLDKVINFLMNPALQGILIMIVIGGIYFELQTPGLGFPIAASIIAAVLYFAPLYLEGIAENWEVMLFVLGVVLLALEVFVIPGFGVAGFGGITLIIIGLTLGMIDNIVFEFDFTTALNAILKAFFTVVVSITISFVLSIYLSKKLFTSQLFPDLALQTVQIDTDGYVGVNTEYKSLVGKNGIAHTVLRPSGRVEVDGEIYDAKSLYGYIDRGEQVTVIRFETGQLYVDKKQG